MVQSASADEKLPERQPALTPAEDHELRQLTWFSKVGQLSERSAARLSELMDRDRRNEVRDPKPNPSSPEDDEPSTLPPLQMDHVASITCPNCGSILPGTDRAH